MSTSLELYGYRTGNNYRAAIALEEAELSYKVRRVDLSQGEQRGSDFRKLNPRGQVPVLVVDSGGGRFILTQSNAIMMYAAESKPGRLFPIEQGEARARAFERYFYFVTDVIAPNQSGFVLSRHAGTAAGEDILKERSHGALIDAERFLADAHYMAGDQFTMADICAFTIARHIESAIDWSTHLRLRAWFDRVNARESVQRGLHAFDEP